MPFLSLYNILFSLIFLFICFSFLCIVAILDPQLSPIALIFSENILIQQLFSRKNPSGAFKPAPATVILGTPFPDSLEIPLPLSHVALLFPGSWVSLYLGLLPGWVACTLFLRKHAREYMCPRRH